MLIVLVLLSLLPFAFGWIVHWFSMIHPTTTPPFMLIGIVFLLIWAAIAFFAKPHIKSTAKIVISMNAVAFLVLVLNGIQQLLLHSYWLNFVGKWTQLFYLPLVFLGARLTIWCPSMFSVACASFLLMVVSTFIGSKIRK